MTSYTLMHSEIFFFISSVGFIIFGIIAVILGILCARAVSSFLRILDKIESSMDTIGDTTQELLDDMRNSFLFQLLLRPKNKKKVRVLSKKP